METWEDTWMVQVAAINDEVQSQSNHKKKNEKSENGKNKKFVGETFLETFLAEVNVIDGEGGRKRKKPVLYGSYHSSTGTDEQPKKKPRAKKKKEDISKTAVAVGRGVAGLHGPAVVTKRSVYARPKPTLRQQQHQRGRKQHPISVRRGKKNNRDGGGHRDTTKPNAEEVDTKKSGAVKNSIASTSNSNMTLLDDQSIGNKTIPVSITNEICPQKLSFFDDNDNISTNITITFIQLTQALADIYTRCKKNLGAGGFGSVALYRKKRSSTSRELVAIKTTEKSSKSTAWKFLEREVNFLSQLDHPNIVKLHDPRYKWIKDGKERRFMIMEFVDGTDMHKRIVSQRPRPGQYRRYSEDEAKTVLRQLVAAMSYANGQGVYHLDLKPANIMVADDEDEINIIIIDWGIARRGGEQLTAKCGTDNFRCPEVEHATRDSIPRDLSKADVWSSAAVIVAMLSGKDNLIPPGVDAGAPSNPQHAKKVLLRLRKSQISEVGRDLLEKMLEDEPERRLSWHEVRQHRWLAQKQAERV